MLTKRVLYVVATPIGNLDDLSARAVNVLSAVDLIAAEDTRHSRPLLTHFGIHTPMVSLHEHNEARVAQSLLDRVQGGEAVALISDAGTPLLSDPGFLLVRAAHARNIHVSPIPGPCAAVCALSVAGLPTDRFVFEGFLSRNEGQRRNRLQTLSMERRTLVFYESSRRLLETLLDMQDIFGGGRDAVIARELTKLHETLLKGPLETLCEKVGTDLVQSRGELVIVVHGQEQTDQTRFLEAERVLGLLIDEMPTKKAAALAAKITGVKKNWLYARALAGRNDN